MSKIVPASMNVRKNKKISIIIPVYNGEKYLREAIDSALTQTYGNIEVIVVNDGSTDGTEKIAQSYGEKIQYYAKENGGVSTALNLAIKKSSGDYISWLSHDDVYYPEKIEKQISYLNKCSDNHNVILFTDYDCIDGNSVVFKEVKLDHELLEKKPEYALLRGMINGCTLLIPREAFNHCGLFDEGLKCTQDYDKWLEMMKEYNFVHMSEKLILYREHEAQGTRSNPLFLKEGNDLWIKIVNTFSIDDKIRLEGSEHAFYREMLCFLEQTLYSGAQEYVREHLDALIKNKQKTNFFCKINMFITWKLPKYIYQFYKKRCKKYIPRTVFNIKDMLFFAFNKSVYGSKNFIQWKIAKEVELKKAPLVTIGIASYNHAEYLEKCIESALHQTYKKIEIVIVDDCSSDPKNREILQKYESHPKVKIIYNTVNKGISASLNTQVLMSSGDWVAFLDCDDYLPENAIADMVRCMKKKPHVRLIYSNRIEVDENDHIIKKRWFGARAKRKNVFEDLLTGMVSSHLKIIHRSVFRKIGLFDTRFDGTHDYDFYLRMAFYYPEQFGYIDKYLYYHRIHARQNTVVESQKHEKNRQIIVKEAKFRKRIYNGDFDKKVSIIILSYNRYKQLKNTVENIQKRVSNINYEIVIWDNHSSYDKLREYLREIDGKNHIRVVFSEKNLRAAGGRKEANKMVDGDYILYFDNDIEITDRFFEEMIIRLEESDDIASCCAKIVFPDHSIQYTGGLIEKDKKYITFSLDNTGRNEHDLRSMQKKDYDWLGTGATMTKKKYFHLAEFDLGFVNAYEDNDYYMQIRKKGFRLVHAPTASVIHHHINYELLKDEGTKKYVQVRHDQESFIQSWVYFYKKWGLIIKDDFIFGIAGLKNKSYAEIKEYIDHYNA